MSHANYPDMTSIWELFYDPAFLLVAKGKDKGIDGADLILLLGLVLISLLGLAFQKRKLDDPENDTVVYTDQIESVSLLADSDRFIVRVFRQSGNIHQDDRLFSSRKDAIRAAVSTFKRAKIEYVAIDENLPHRLTFRRPFHCHRGRSEGKKIGKISILRA